MASDLIRKADLLKRIDEWQQVLTPRFELRDGIIFDTLESVNWHIDDMPTVDAVEVVHGVWIDMREAYNDVPNVKCSICGRVWFGLETDYCPNCGAKMDGASDD